MSKGRSADSSGQISGTELEKASPGVRGRPFRKGESGNPSGRPGTAGQFRALAREAAAALLDEVVNRASKIEFQQLMQALNDVATRGGCLTDEKMVEIDSQRLSALAAVLSGTQLTVEQRTKILEDYQAHLKAQTEAA